MQLWGGRFTKDTEQIVQDFHNSISFGKKLIFDDIKGSLAHVKMLVHCDIIPEQDGEKIIEGLKSILEEAENETLTYSDEVEDIHMNIEKLLIDRIGPVGGKMHTGRSRNDQTATDRHLYLRRECKVIINLLNNLLKTIVKQAETNFGIIIPGYTHLQRAQPVLFSHHLMAYYEMFKRDIERLQDTLKRIDILPLGAAALAGTTFPISREFVANELGFSNIYKNSMDAVSDRDFIIEYHNDASIIMMHLSRFCEEIILWASAEFNFIELDDGYSTGSSIMPQKKNPDMAELIRGKTGRVYGNLIGILSMMKSLPLSYNKDMLEDMEGMFDTTETLEKSLPVFTGMLDTISVNEVRLESVVKEDFSNATDLADYLVRKGLPFRQAHEVIGKLVLYCIQKEIFLHELSLDEYKEYNTLFEKDVFETINPQKVVRDRDILGGTGHDRVEEAITVAKREIESFDNWIKEEFKIE